MANLPVELRANGHRKVVAMARSRRLLLPVRGLRRVLGAPDACSSSMALTSRARSGLVPSWFESPLTGQRRTRFSFSGDYYSED